MGGLLVCLITVMLLYFAVIRPQTVKTAQTAATNNQLTAIAQATESPGEENTPEPSQNTPQAEPTLPAEQLEKTSDNASDILLISANLNTNCREGPDTDYAIVGHFKRGETSEVHGTNTYQTWWYIENPDNPDDYCWVWGDTTYVEGETSDVGVITPPPPPPPGPDFNATFAGYSDCFEFNNEV